MRSLNWLVPRARVMFSGGNDITGSLDKRCEAGEPVVITSEAHDCHSALPRALARASKSLRHPWQQEQNALGKHRTLNRKTEPHV